LPGRESRLRGFTRFFQTEVSGAVVLLAAALAAVLLANSGAAGWYGWFRHAPIGVFSRWAHINVDVASIVDDMLMTLFFLVIGLEIKREVLVGELSSLRRAVAPILAAAGGMIVPALLFALVNRGDASALRGWGVPVATDIAFALGVLALAGRRVPTAMRVFLAALAIADDVGAILVIALFYSAGIHLQWLIAVVAIVAVLAAMNRLGVTTPLLYLAVGVLLWVAVLKAGLHASLAGVLLAATIPMAVSPRIEFALHPITTYLVLPLFAFVNAGVAFAGGAEALVTSRVAAGVVLGLVVGKPLGILAASWLAVRSGLASLADGIRWRHVAVVGMLAGIGFTMSLFVTNLAFGSTSSMAEESRAAILVSSLVAGVAGLAVLRLACPVSEVPPSV
jgi:NhaA family Na+:H+ antiporter